MNQQPVQLPKNGLPRTQILERMQAAKEKDINWQNGRAFSLVFQARPDVSEVLKDAYTMFFSENGLNPTAFPSLRKFETEVIAMAADLLSGDSDVVGNMTSGGTESILMAVKTAREWGKTHKPQANPPQMILPATAHPAFHKAAFYFGVEPVLTPVGIDFRADVTAVREALTERTILIVGSAPSYPQGVVDPIADLAALAQASGILFHVDACVGGFMLPFVRKLGYPVPDFDFAIPGVTSISADLHKYGYAAKPASLILYRTGALRRLQYFVHTDWSGGIYASPAMTGTRPGGAIAAAWAILNYLGEEGYLEITRAVMETVQQIKRGVDAIPGVEILSDPEMSILALASDQYNIYEIGDQLTLRDWHLDRQQFPPSLHLTVNYMHTRTGDQFLRDLAEAAADVRKPKFHRIIDRMVVRLANTAVRLLPPNVASHLMERTSNLIGVKGSNLPQRSAAMYGMMGTLPNRGDLHEVVLDLIDRLTRLDPPH